MREQMNTSAKRLLALIHCLDNVRQRRKIRTIAIKSRNLLET
jgi:hypothetical protein